MKLLLNFLAGAAVGLALMTPIFYRSPAPQAPHPAAKSPLVRARATPLVRTTAPVRLVESAPARKFRVIEKTRRVASAPRPRRAPAPAPRRPATRPTPVPPRAVPTVNAPSEELVLHPAPEPPRPERHALIVEPMADEPAVVERAEALEPVPEATPEPTLVLPPEKRLEIQLQP